MARIEILQPREQKSHYGLYRTSAGGDQAIFVRRKVGEPTDVVHANSRKLQRQREYLTLASRHYAHLSPSQKAITRHQFEIVEYETGHSKTETKLLTGRQLFIAREIRSLAVTGKQLVLPHELCVMLTDPGLNPIDGELWLRHREGGIWTDAEKDKIFPGHFLFSQVPKGSEYYRVYGEFPGFFDPQEAEHQYMSEEEILAYHYHILIPAVEPIIWTTPFWHISLHAMFTAPYDFSTAFVDFQMTFKDTENNCYFDFRKTPTQVIKRIWRWINVTDPTPVRQTMLANNFSITEGSVFHAYVGGSVYGHQRVCGTISVYCIP